MKKIFLIFIFYGSLAAYSQQESLSLKVFTFSEVEKMNQEKPKPIVVFIYTDWCKIIELYT